MGKLIFFFIVLHGTLFSNKLVSPVSYKVLGSPKASRIFLEALDEFYQKHYVKAYSLFIKIKDVDKKVCLFNAALSLERSSRYKEALSLYKQLNTKKSVYRESACCHYLADSLCVINSLNKWKKKGKRLSLAEGFEYRVRVGNAYKDLNAFNEAIDYLIPAIKMFSERKKDLIKDANLKGFREGRIDQLAIWAFSSIAKSYIKQGDRLVLSLSNKTLLKRQLDIKTAYYLNAQNAFLKLVELGDVFYACKGLYSISSLYKHIYDEMINTPSPKEIDEDELSKEYEKELNKLLSPLLYKAIASSKKVIDLQKKYGFKNEWINKSEQILKDLKSYQTVH